jgi:hypothetical protein
MTLATVGAGLAARLDTISGLRVYATPPDSVQELPAAIVAFRGTLATYDHVMGAADVRYSLTCSFWWVPPMRGRPRRTWNHT